MTVRIFAVAPNYPPHSRVGAWIATHAYLAHLTTLGHSVTVLPLCNDGATYSLDGVNVIPFGRGRDLINGVRSADVVISHCGDNGAAADAAARYQKPSLRMAHGRITNPAVLTGAALVVFNSASLAASVTCPSPWIICRPAVDPTVYATTPGDRVTLVNLSEAKGGELFWRLARCAAHRRFLAVKGGYGVQYLEELPNVDVIANTQNMRDDVYRRTRILLMPSESETWGMVAVEALASGIPVIAHPTDGLRESLGPAGVFVDRADGAGWLTEIERLHDPVEWAAAAATASARSAALHPATDLTRFAAAIEHLGAHECVP